MEMEKRKRQREIVDHQEDPSCVVGGRGKRAMMREDGPEGGEAVGARAPPTPSEEEVEEFFAILRRMHEAVKYFNSKSRAGGGDRRWSTALEAEAVAMVCGEEEGEEEQEEQEEVDNPIDDDDKGNDSSKEDDRGVEQINGDDGDHLLDLNSSPKDGHGGD